MSDPGTTLGDGDPVHPGAHIRAAIIDPRGLTVSEAAKVLGVTRPTLSNLLNANAALSPEMAIRLEKAFGVSMEELVQMQCRYDIAQARRRAGEINVAPYAGKLKAAEQGNLL